MSDKTAIQVDKTTKDLLDNLGKKGETYNAIIIRMVKNSPADKAVSP